MQADRKDRTVKDALSQWYNDYRPTFTASYAQLAELNIRLHLAPSFGHLRLIEIREKHVIQFIGAKTNPDTDGRPLKAATLQNILSTLRRVLTLAVDEGEITRNPCRNLGKLLAIRRSSSNLSWGWHPPPAAPGAFCRPRPDSGLGFRPEG